MTAHERELAVIEAEKWIQKREPDEAMRLCNKVLNDDPDYVPALFTAGRILMQSERFGMAYSLNKRCTEIKPGESACWNNAGMCAAAIPSRLAEGEAMLRKALKIDRNNKSALNNMTLVKVHQCDPKAAIEFAKQSLAMQDDQPEVLENKGYAHLLLGEFGPGWDGYEASVGFSKYRKDVSYGGEPRWAGEVGGRLIVREEQGIGDAISFASILPDAMQDNTITLECDKRLEGLFKRSFPDLEVLGTKSEKQATWAKGREWDWHALIGSLAHKYRRSPESFPGTPFLVADPERRAQWRVLLDRLPGLKIGLAWTGGLPNTFKDRRSLSLETLAPILKTPGCAFVSLQYRDPTEEIAAVAARHGVKVTHWARAAQAIDYDEVAALVAELDLVICVTTAAVDCAGALGKDCWVMVPSKPHWRYGLSGDKKVWYDSVRLYRQRGTDWGRVVEQIAHDLREKCSTSSSESMSDSPLHTRSSECPSRGDQASPLQ